MGLFGFGMKRRVVQRDVFVQLCQWDLSSGERCKDVGSSRCAMCACELCEDHAYVDGIRKHSRKRYCMDCLLELIGRRVWQE